jgi:hypothetical protein
VTMRGKRVGRWILLGIVVIGAAAWWSLGRDADAPAGEVPSALLGGDPAAVERVVPADVRIRVEVLNGTSTRGLARRATFHLRDLGFDVVGSGNAASREDSSLVLVHTGRMDWGELAARALGGARIEARPDTSRYLDLTIVLGSAWRAPAEALHP